MNRRFFVFAILLLVGFSNTGFGTDAVDAGLAQQTMADMRAVAVAFEAYSVDYGGFPDVRGLDSLREELVPLYLKELPGTDAWGTPWRIFLETKPCTIHIVSAGADRVFDSASWSQSGEFHDPAQDLVVEGARFLRCWIPRDPFAQDLAYAQLTLEDMNLLAGALSRYIDFHRSFPNVENFADALVPNILGQIPLTDRWGTPWRYSVSEDQSSYILVSAGSDREFLPDTWTEKAVDLPFEADIVIVDARIVRKPWQSGAN